MLQQNPDDRWPSLEEAATELRRLEDEARTVAKAVYMDLEKNKEFFAGFYDRFFESCEEARMKFQGLDMIAAYD
ncbi:MAG TPA: hypothetical protein VMN03_04280, partial [Burkholderiales bacterium]|nr:hypothetical protein [Burkholderiales bacterium]